jgi:NhaP-type Na+/H+ or K+/H+ antiporter
MKKAFVTMALVLSLFVLPGTSRAQSSLEVVLWDSLLGAGIGALVGAATLAFMDHPGDHMERIAQGASVGLIGGIAFGFYEISPVFYSSVDPSGNRERVYGLRVAIPLK